MTPQRCLRSAAIIALIAGASLVVSGCEEDFEPSFGDGSAQAATSDGDSTDGATDQGSADNSNPDDTSDSTDNSSGDSAGDDNDANSGGSNTGDGASNNGGSDNNGSGSSGSGDNATGDDSGNDSGDDDSNTSDGSDTDDGSSTTGGSSAAQTFRIEPGENATKEALVAFNAAEIGDTIKFACGFFSFDTVLQVRDTEGVTITGCGMDKTVLSFQNSDSPVGLLFSNDRGITVSDLTVTDTPGDGIKVKSSDIVTYRNVRAMWSSTDNQVTASNYETAIHYECPASIAEPFTYQPDSDNGRYAIYPVQTTNVLLDNVESLGASDAGIYVGQTDDVIIRDSHALYNVAGFEFENTQRADMDNNVAECNTVGYIIYDLPFLTQFGYEARLHDSVSRNNNFDNFSKGGIVSKVPPGSGMITLAFDQVEIDNNEFKDNKTGGVIITSYELVGDDGDKRQDIYTEALSVHDNEFNNNGYNPPAPDPQAAANGSQATLLPTLIRVKNGGFGADILWDGLYDEPRSGCSYPVAPNGKRVPSNDRGKPLFEGFDFQPDCRYNQYKFTDSGERQKPEMWLCFENNTYTGSPEAPDFSNFHGTEGIDGLMSGDPTAAPNAVADNDITPHLCKQQYGETLPPVKGVTLAEYQPPAGGPEQLTDAQIKQICEQETGGAINRNALEKADCPTLSSYHLFQNPDDPSRKPAASGVPFDLNTKLFADYAVKYRFVFMPTGEKAIYHDRSEGTNKTYEFPVGTVIAKTFSFPHADDSINHVETRLLIKRQDPRQSEPHWVGLPYIWNEDGDERVAKLTPEGGTAQVHWHYQKDSNGETRDGSTEHYSVPTKNQCIECHSNTHRTTGPAPIGLKPRNLNKPYPYTSGKQNQIAYWKQNGLLKRAPELNINGDMIATNVLRIPHFDVPGDSGAAPGSDEDIEARVRGYLEVNCAHCHNKGGEASNTGLYLDTLRKVGAHYGICKEPTAAGNGSGGRNFDIHPQQSDDSIMPFRIGSNEPAAQMPPIARSVVHKQIYQLVQNWINNVVDDSYDNADSCDGSVPGSGQLPSTGTGDTQPPNEGNGIVNTPG